MIEVTNMSFKMSTVSLNTGHQKRQENDE